MRGPTVLVTQPIHKKGLDLLRQHAEVVIARSPAIPALVEEARSADAIIVRATPLPAEVLRSGPNLRVVGRHGVGYDNIDVATATELGLMVVYAPGTNTDTVAEHALALLFSAARHIPWCDKQARSGNFDVRLSFVSCDVAGKTVGLIGLGAIGRSFATKCRALGMRTIGFDPFLTEPPAGIELRCSLDDLLQEADFVSLHAQATMSNRKMLGAREFGMMKEGAVFINTARGSLVNEEALAEALESGRLAAAAIDVFEPEPPRPDNPLLCCERLILTPHVAPNSEEALIRMAVTVSEQILKALNGQTPDHLANPEVLSRRPSL